MQKKILHFFEQALIPSELSLESNSLHAKVPLDKTISNMCETSEDKNSKYKETSKGRLAIGVNLSDC